MRLKVLIVPFFIALVLILGIGYIKPDLDVIQTKKAEIATKEALAANVDAVVTNVETLNTSLDMQQESEKFIYRYLPETLNQDQVIDAFNFLTTQFGLAIVEMELKQPPQAVAEEPITLPSGALVLAGSAEGDAVAPQPAPVAARTFILTGSVTGSYENIKAFFDALSRIDRFHTVRFFSIAAETVKQSAATSGGASQTSRLIGTFEAEFGYVPPKPVMQALTLPVFQHSTFDFSAVSRLLDRTTTSIPPLMKGETGKPNPFQ